MNIEKEVVLCAGKKMDGRECKNRPANGLNCCWSHRDQEENISRERDVTSFNTTCPICLDDTGSMIILSCLHRFHEKCCENLTDLNCQLCQQHVINYPPNLKKLIEKNSAARASELVEEDRQNLLQQQETLFSRMAIYMQPPPNIEIMSALQYLRERGVPLKYIPQNVRISVQRGQPRILPGVLFTAIVGQVMERVQKDLGNGELYDDSEDEDVEYEEDPFSQENDELEILERSVRFFIAG